MKICPTSPSLAAIGLALAAPLLHAAESAPTEKPDTELVTLEEVLVTGTTAPAPYSAPISITATKTATRDLDNPQATQTVKRQLLDDQGTITLEEALRNVAGVMPGGYYADWDYYRIRGFDASIETYMDGLLGNTSMNAELFGMERIDIIKGPASSLYGPAPLGGLVNLISKRPKPVWFANPEFTIGSNNLYQPAIDFGGVLNERGTVYFRVNALTRTQDSVTDYAHKERLYIAPSLTWDIGPETSITFLTNYQRDVGHLAMPLPAWGTVLPNRNGPISINRFIGDTDYSNNVYSEIAEFGYQFGHRFNDIFSVRQNFRLTHGEQTWDRLLYPAFLDADQRTLYRYPYDYNSTFTNWRIDTAVDAKFTTGPVGHLIVLGVDYQRNYERWRSAQIDYSDPTAYMPIDLYDPHYGKVDFPAMKTRGFATGAADNVGFYLQEQAKLWDRVTITLSGRVDSSWVADTDDVTGEVSRANETAFSPRIGITYEFIKGLSIYGSYSQAFKPQPGMRDVAGAQIGAQTGENWEIGFKQEMCDGRFQSTLSLFDLTKSNIAVTNPGAPFAYIASGEQRSQGFEFSGAYNPVPGLNIIAAYTYLDARVASDTNIPERTPLINVPEHTLSAWIKYTLQDTCLKGFGVGLGGSYYTEQSGDQLHTFDIPAYGLVNAGVFYDRERFHAQVNFTNILDRRYFTGSYDNLYVSPGDGFGVRATVRYEF